MKKIFILTGEPSGDKLASEIVSKLKEIMPDIEYLSVGGSNLKKLGIKTIFNLNEITFLGFTKVILNLFKIKRKIDFSINEIIKYNPDILFTVDSPDFTLRVAKGVKKLNKTIKIIHFVAPQVWIWRKNRVKKIKKFLDHILLLFKFEKKYFDEEKIKNTFVGHPLLSKNIPIDLNNISNIEKKIISIFPGSRLSETKILLPICFDFVRLMNKKFLDFTYYIHTSDELIELINNEVIKSNLLNIKVISEDNMKNLILSKSIFAVAKSGTISLEISNAKIPYITIYKISFINFLLIKFFVKIKYVNIINIINNKEIIPELLQNECNADEIFRTVNYFIRHPELSKNQIETCQKTLDQIRLKTSSSLEVAKILQEYLVT